MLAFSAKMEPYKYYTGTNDGPHSQPRSKQHLYHQSGLPPSIVHATPYYAEGPGNTFLLTRKIHYSIQVDI